MKNRIVGYLFGLTDIALVGEDRMGNMVTSISDNMSRSALLNQFKIDGINPHYFVKRI